MTWWGVKLARVTSLPPRVPLLLLILFLGGCASAPQEEYAYYDYPPGVEVVIKDGVHYISIQNIKTSREWLNHVVQDYVHDKEFKVPKKYVRMIKKIL